MDLSSSGVHATDLSAQFYTHFQSKKNEISSRLENLKTTNTASPDFISISSEIVALRKDLVDATPYLPTYDRGKCEKQIKVLEESLSNLRAPKTKFAFKRKPQIAQPTPSPSSKLDIPAPRTIVPSPIPSSSTVTSNLSLSSKSAAYLSLSSLSSDLPKSSDVTLTGIKSCVVNLCSDIDSMLEITALHAKSLHQVLLLMPPIEGSILLHDIHDCILIVGCRQFRMHDSTNVTVLLHVLSNPIIERSRNIRFGPYPEAFQHMTPMSFIERPSSHLMAQDFDWIKPTPSPNFVFLDSTPTLVERVMRIVKDGVRDDEVKGILEQVWENDAR